MTQQSYFTVESDGSIKTATTTTITERDYLESLEKQLDLDTYSREAALLEQIKRDKTYRDSE